MGMDPNLYWDKSGSLTSDHEKSNSSADELRLSLKNFSRHSTY